MFYGSSYLQGETILPVPRKRIPLFSRHLFLSSSCGTQRTDRPTDPGTTDRRQFTPNGKRNDRGWREEGPGGVRRTDGRRGGGGGQEVRNSPNFFSMNNVVFFFTLPPPLLCFLRLRMGKLFPPFPVMGQSLRTSCVLLFLHERPTPTLLLFLAQRGREKGEGGREGDEE